MNCPFHGLPNERRLGVVLSQPLQWLSLWWSIGGVALLLEDAAVSSSTPIERIALVETPPGVEPPLTVVNSSVTTDGFEVLPPIEMWLWERAGSPSAWVGLLDTDPNADLSVFGPIVDGGALSPPTDGGVDTGVLADFGGSTRSWVEGSSWRIALGYDESMVAAVAEQAASGDASRLELEDLELAYVGPQVLYPSAQVELSELFYRASNGGILGCIIQRLGHRHAHVSTHIAERRGH